jgi:dinuclear metal center YbgI/SA1388 family protein
VPPGTALISRELPSSRLPRVSAARDEILAFLDAELETSRYHDYAPIGMQVIGAERVERVACAVSSTLEVFDRAAVEGTQLLLVHHGMFWDNEPRVIGRHMKRRLERLFASDITLAAYHLPLDGHQRLGNNARLAEELHLRVDGWFSEHGGIPLAVHGTLAAAVPLQTLAERVSEIAGRVPIAFPGGPERVRTLAICSGRPGGIAFEAAATGADALLTGEPQEDFRALARELGISIVCAGHHATETLGVRAAAQLVSERFGVEHVFIDAPNPV